MIAFAIVSQCCIKDEVWIVKVCRTNGCEKKNVRRVLTEYTFLCTRENLGISLQVSREEMVVELNVQLSSEGKRPVDV